MTTLNLNSITFSYSSVAVLKDISLTIQTGQIGCLLGPSGCGKSTLLRLIAGFEEPSAGHIYIEDTLVANSKQSLDPQNRHVGMLFQNLALFPHLTVAENITYGLHHLEQHQQQQRLDELLELCRLHALKSRFPHQISGGQCQRVALARAMAPKPKLILLDEPFSNIDTGLQNEMAQEVKVMLQADNSTALWVTHSLEEAFAVADQIGVILDGQLLQWSTPKELYYKPAHTDVIRFLNRANLIKGQIATNGQLKSSLGSHKLINSEQFKLGEEVIIGVPKEHFKIKASTDSNATITACIYQGGQHKISATFNDGNKVQFHHQAECQKGQKVYLEIHTETAYQGFKL